MQPLWKLVWRVLRQLRSDLLHDSVIPLLEICLEEIKSAFYKVTCNPTLTVAQFAITKTWKPPRYPIKRGKDKEMWYIYLTEYYTAIKINEILLFATKLSQMKIILNETKQSQKIKYHDLSDLGNLYAKHKINIKANKYSQIFPHRNCKLETIMPGSKEVLQWMSIPKWK